MSKARTLLTERTFYSKPNVAQTFTNFRSVALSMTVHDSQRLKVMFENATFSATRIFPFRFDVGSAIPPLSKHVFREGRGSDDVSLCDSEIQLVT